MVKGVKSFIKPPFLHLWSNPSFYWMGVGKHYPNRTSVLNNFFLDSYHARASNKVKHCVADQALVREGDSRRNPVPLLANHKKFIRSALFLVNKHSG